VFYLLVYLIALRFKLFGFHLSSCSLRNESKNGLTASWSNITSNSLGFISQLLNRNRTCKTRKEKRNHTLQNVARVGPQTN